MDSVTSDLSKKLDPFRGSGIDIHDAILKVAPKKGFVMPGHRYTGPGNPLEQQLRYDPNTGQILEIYQRQRGHAIARNAIAAKSKLGMGVKKPKNVKSRRVRKTGKKN